MDLEVVGLHKGQYAEGSDEAPDVETIGTAVDGTSFSLVGEIKAEWDLMTRQSTDYKNLPSGPIRDSSGVKKSKSINGTSPSTPKGGRH